MTSNDGPPGFDSSIPHPARRYDYWLDGKDNFQADRTSGDAIAAIFPSIRVAARANRRFLARIVRHLVTECGIRQFLDIGTGLPTAGNTHEVAQSIDPSCRIVYVDNDPIVLVHARALLTSHPAGRTSYLDADLRNAQKIIGSDAVADTLDLTQPIAVLLIAVLHFFGSDDEARSIVQQLVEPLAPGCYLAMSHATTDLLDPEIVAKFAAAKAPGGDITGRSYQQFAALLDGLDIQPPGIQVVSRWRPDPGIDPPPDDQVSVYGALARVADGTAARR